MTAAAEERLPLLEPLDAKERNSRMVNVRLYQNSGAKHRRAMSWPIDQYFCVRSSGPTAEDARFVLDEAGLPQQRDKRGSYYHPLSLARYVINLSITYMNRRNPVMYHLTQTGADKLVTIMGPDGAFRYQHPFWLYYYGNLPAGWASALTQGTALSAFARAYHVTCDRKYLQAGEKALAFLLTPMEKGGTATSLRYLDPSLADYVWYEEYPNADKPAYTLAGYMYTLLGLHEWAETTGSVKAREAFEAGVRSLAKILPLYDYDGFSCYDLAPIVYGKPVAFMARYHRAHIDQLSALYAITGNPILEEYRVRWYEGVGGPVQTCEGS